MLSEHTITVAIEEGVTLPHYKTPGSAGMDLHAFIAEPFILQPGCCHPVPTGIRVHIPSGYEIQIRPRSGLATKNLISVINAPGTIDEDYRGEILIPLMNYGKEPFEVLPNMRIAQMVLARVEKMNLRTGYVQDNTQRGRGGFGSTGA